MKFGDSMYRNKQVSNMLTLLYVSFLIYRFIRLLLVNGNDDFWIQEYPLNEGVFWYYISVSILIFLYSLNHALEWINIHERVLIVLLVLYLPFSIPLFVLILCRGIIDQKIKYEFRIFHARYLIVNVPSILLVYMVFSIPFIHQLFSVQKTQDMVEVDFDIYNFNLHGEDGYVRGKVDLYFHDDDLYMIKVELEMPNGILESSAPISLYINGIELCEGHIEANKILFTEIVGFESSEIKFTDELEFSYSFENILYDIEYRDLNRYERFVEYHIFDYK